MKIKNYRLNILKLSGFAIATILVGAYTQLPAQAQDGRACQVSDPTGTPLNARLQPNGKIVNRLRNGRTVYAQSISTDSEGKPWVLVAIRSQGRYKIMGYVLREFISCY